MAKNKSVFVCQECGNESLGWMGRCPSCNQWNTLVEEVHVKNSSTRTSKTSNKPVNINDISIQNEERFLTGMNELDRVLGGGIVQGSLILVGGDPGIGKSTLILQICNTITNCDNILYVSGEESIKQIKLRANRLGITNKSLNMISETDFSIIEDIIYKEKPSLIIIDSIQTMFNSSMTSSPGSVGQVRDVTGKLVQIGKSNNISILIIGHVTKEGAIAGPRVLEHMVDTVLYFEGERHLTYRVLRAVKNRFGSTNEIGIFEMKQEGLVEVDNPSSALLSERPKNASGSVVVSTNEGSRPLLIEVQALVSPTVFGMPRRMATGIDYNRIVMLMAVLEKRMGLQLSNYDAYVNVVGGIKINDPACDLGIIAAISSSFKNTSISPDTVLIGEVGLAGEVRAVNNIEKRVMEALRIGFKTCIIPAGNFKTLSELQEFKQVDIKPVQNVQKTLSILF